MIREKFVPEMFVKDQSTKYVYLENIVLYCMQCLTAVHHH